MGFKTKDTQMEKQVNHQNGRVSFTLSFNGLIVGGTSDYHPEKLNVSLTRSVDYIEGETPQQTKARVDAMDTLEQIIVEKVETSLYSKVKEIRDQVNNR